MIPFDGYETGEPLQAEEKSVKNASSVVVQKKSVVEIIRFLANSPVVIPVGHVFLCSANYLSLKGFLACHSFYIFSLQMERVYEQRLCIHKTYKNNSTTQ